MSATKVFVLCLCGFLHLDVVLGITCWECANAYGEEECLRNGRETKCGPDQDMCQIQVRRGGWGAKPLLDKSCKTVASCGSNHIQNLKSAWAYKGDQIQCNTHAPSSVCRCCCGTDLCNFATIDCNKKNTVAGCRPLKRMRNGWMKCTFGVAPHSTCEFGCRRYYHLVGPSSITCDYFGKWSGRQPKCKMVSCPPLPKAPEFGFVECTKGTSLWSRCSFQCEEGYRLQGPPTIQCLETRWGGRYGLWSRLPPVCKPLKCPEFDVFNHGHITCSHENYVTSHCSFNCDAEGGYMVFPADVPEVTCQRNQQWNAPRPCCTLPCPPNAIMDFIIILDSSSSVGKDNWDITKRFVKSFLKEFIVRNDIGRYGGFRYNREVDRQTVIYLDDHPESRDDFFKSFDQMEYNGNGTHTGKALNFTVDVMLKRGNRDLAKDVVLLITDGSSQDDVTVPARRLLDTGALVYVVPVLPPKGKLNIDQIQAIAGRPQNVMEDALTGGFEALNDLFAEKITEILCLNPCTNPFHDHDR